MDKLLEWRILDLYLFKELIIPFLFGLCLFSFLGVSLGALFELIREIIAGLSLNIAWQIFILKIPLFISLALPMASLFAGLVAYNRLVNNNEFLALRSCGISLHRWLRASFFFGILVSILCLLVNEIVVPISNYSISNLYNKTLITNKKTSSLSYTIYNYSSSTEILSQFLYAKYFDGNFIKDLILLDFTKGNLKSILTADSAVLQFSTNTWICYDGQIYLISAQTPYTHSIKFKTQKIHNFNLSKSLANIKYFPNWMNIRSSKAYKKIFQISNNEVELRKLNIRIYQKYNAPLTCLILSSIGAILGSSAQHKTFFRGFSGSLSIIFFYYISGFISEAAGLAGFFPAWLAAWAPNLCCILIIGMILTREE